MPPTNPQLPADSAPDSTDAFLDHAFDLAIEAIQRGEQPSPESLADTRPDLQSQIDDLIAAAHRLVARRPAIAEPAARDIPGYRLIAELGRGGMGIVHRAQQLSVANREVALKLLPAGVLGSSAARFTHESRAIARLKHPGIIAIHDVITPDDGPAAIAMELIDGPSLSRLIAKLSPPWVVRHSVPNSAPGYHHAPRSVRSQFLAPRTTTEPAPDPSASAARSASAANLMDRARDLLGTPPNASSASPALSPSYPVFICRLGASLARALDAVHQAGLIHRDIKPANILLRRDGSPVLTDFGLARDLASDATMHTQTGAFLGTAAYAPPEQIRGEHDRIDARSDVYSLGATLFHALSLRPMPARSPAEALRFFERGHALPPLRKLNPRLPRDLETIITKATDPDPSRRYQSAADLADDLDRLLQLRPIRARPISPLGRAWRAARRNWRTLTAAAATFTVTVALVSAAVMWWAVLPRWQEDHVRSARLSLLDPDHSARVHAALWGLPLEPETLFLDRAIGEYSAANRWRALSSLDRLEFDTVLAARELEQGLPRPALLERLRVNAPTAVQYAGHSVTGNPVSFTVPSGASETDCRCTGLLAYLRRDPDTCLNAWSHLDLDAHPDPLVEASRGQLLLARDEPDPAYPLLASAARSFDTEGFLWTDLADAAVRIGALDAAARDLERAQRVGHPETAPNQARVQADLNSARGWAARQAGDMDTAHRLDEQARALYEIVRRERILPTARDHYADFLQKRGAWRESLKIRIETIGLRPTSTLYRRHFDDSTDRWWASLNEADRAIELHRFLDGDPWFTEVLRVRTQHNPAGATPPGRQSPDHAFAPAPVGLDAFATMLNIHDLSITYGLLGLPRDAQRARLDPQLRPLMQGTAAAQSAGPLPFVLFDTQFLEPRWAIIERPAPGWSCATQPTTESDRPGPTRLVRLTPQPDAPRSPLPAAVIALCTEVYDPTIRGPIDRLHMRVDVRHTAGEAGVGLVVEQAGRVYFAFRWTATMGDLWAPYITLDLAATDFTPWGTLDGTSFLEPLHPDFSPTGAPLRFGFVVLAVHRENQGPTLGETLIGDWAVVAQSR